MAFKLLPDQATLRQLLDYDPATGLLHWKERTENMFTVLGRAPAHQAKVWNARNAGMPAFNTKHCNGYRFGSLGGSNFLAHRVVWMWVHGEQPDVIDHINGRKSDNRISNLRSVNHSGNSRNMPRLCNNTSGHTGIYRCNTTGRWRAELVIDGKSIKLGRFTDLKDAAAARRAAEREFGFHENHGRPT